MASGSHGSSASLRNGIRRNNSLSAVHTLSSVNDVAPPKSSNSNRVPGRASMDSFDRAKFFRPSAADTIVSSSPPKPRSWHKKSSSSPSNLPSPPLGPQSISLPGTPSLTSLASIPAVVVEDEVEPLDIRSSGAPQSYPGNPPPPSSSSMFFGRTGAGSAASTPAGTPPASPSLRAAATANISASPSPSTTPPSSPSLSFLTTWQGRLPSIPRPSPMTPFRAARKVVTSVTAVGSGLLPSKEQLGSIPVAGRIIKHPVMDSTLNYIASKTTHRKESKPISPEDIHYRKLNKKLVDQAITLASLAIEKEELSKTLDDEEGDDAFELYLAAISTLMHAIPIETCDPLRREAFEAQLRGFLQDHEFDSADEDINEKQRRRRRRHRHRRHHEQATHLIDQHALVLTDDGGSTSPPPVTQSARSSRGSRGGRRRRKGGRSNGRIQTGSSIGDTIITTAVQSAIRLKQSPIPDVIKTCLRTSRAILSHVDQRFNLQERAWQLSKNSIEKAIELDEQYAIHEVVAETFFATVTGLVKAGIAYKETPGYMSLKALTGPPHPPSNPSTQGALVLRPPDRSNHPQSIKESPWDQTTDKRRRYSIIAEEEEEYVFQQDRNDRVSDDEGPESLSTSSSSCFTTSEDESIDDNEEVGMQSSGKDLFAAAAGSLPEEYSEQVRQKVGLFVALKTAASMLMGSQV
ncbi:hypothetical protein EMPS_05699 [Entomortierella parvispora]|uniref:Uncharacterized protein n=1 Tax=Entomortierella parvispora TaxID=205924 RepID=A0A9P3HAX4_9FUNG|nr:hypothetical protein EMPS_05699 [Entomortierella parvispora]